MDLTQPWHSGDVTFVIEDGKIYVNKAVLGMCSEVFRAMFTSEFKEKKMTEILLPSKKFDDFLAFMQIIHPLPKISMDNTNVEGILHLAHEYQIHQVVERCEQLLVKQPPSIHNLILADKFSLATLRQVFFDYLKRVPYAKLAENPEFEMVDKATRTEVFERHSMHQQPSIENLFLAEKYQVPEVQEKCLKYLKDTALPMLKAEPGFTNLKPETLIEVLTYKAEQLEALKTEISSLTNWGALHQQELCTATSNQQRSGSAAGFGVFGGFGNNQPIQLIPAKPFGVSASQASQYTSQHLKGDDESCYKCLQYRFSEMGNVIKRY